MAMLIPSTVDEVTPAWLSEVLAAEAIIDLDVLGLLAERLGATG